jgi:hypothetical protein
MCALVLLFPCACNEFFFPFVSGYSKVGHFGDTNRPGYPKKLLLVGKFASAGSARSPLSALTVPTKEQAEDVMTLNMLSTFIINAYRPGDTILIAMNQPICFCIGQQDLVSLVNVCPMTCYYVNIYIYRHIYIYIYTWVSLWVCVCVCVCLCCVHVPKTLTNYVACRFTTSGFIFFRVTFANERHDCLRSQVD